MKHWTYILFLTLISCKNQQQRVNTSDTSISTQSTSLTDIKKEICWTGYLNGKIPIFIHYQLDNNLIIGEIIYLNTKDKLPIKILGTLEDDQSYRLLEFESTGNITGVIEGNPKGKIFNGIWFSPKTKNEFTVTLSSIDTIIQSPGIKPVTNLIFGNYHYQYGDKGFNGDFEINSIGNNKVEFNILSLTNIERGGNVAEVEKDTIVLKGNSFIYKIPASDSCEFKTTFYKDFVYINYTKGYCMGQFGLNATIDGIYLKTK